PQCMRCGRPTTKFITRSSNRNGNAGRPYYKCGPCKKFHNFADNRGINTDNPKCCCGQVSRMQKSGVGVLHFVCQFGCCNFY
ncbi:uncharacterized protein K452DRAFT_192195, partial [Aplosporella prunicola CBS 121167]